MKYVCTQREWHTYIHGVTHTHTHTYTHTHTHTHTDSPTQYWIARQMSTWSLLTFFFAVVINVLVAFFYPYDKDRDFIGKRVLN